MIGRVLCKVDKKPAKGKQAERERQAHRELIGRLGHNLKHMRLKAGLTIGQFATFLDLGFNILGGIEDGNYPFSVPALVRISLAVGWSVPDLLVAQDPADPAVKWDVVPSRAAVKRKTVKIKQQQALARQVSRQAVVTLRPRRRKTIRASKLLSQMGDGRPDEPIWIKEWD